MGTAGEQRSNRLSGKYTCPTTGVYQQRVEYGGKQRQIDTKRDRERDLVARIGCVISGLVQASRLHGTESNNKMSFSVSAMTAGRYCIRPPSSGIYKQTNSADSRAMCEYETELLLVYVCVYV